MQLPYRRASIGQIAPIIRANIARETRLMTDEARYYNEVGRDFDSHETVNHAREEYVRGDITPTRLKAIIQFSNAARRASTSICAEKHLHRYLSEFDFRYSNRDALGVNDGERADLAIKASASKRLAYRQPH